MQTDASSKRSSRWLVKQEPSAYSWLNFLADGETEWTGVRNYQARNFLRSMQQDDLVLFYHSVTEKQIVGIAKVSASAYPDPTASTPDSGWVCVRLTPVSPLPNPVTLEKIKANPLLQEIALLRQSRLSVMPLRSEEFDEIVRMGKSKPL